MPGIQKLGNILENKGVQKLIKIVFLFQYLILFSIRDIFQKDLEKKIRIDKIIDLDFF